MATVITINSKQNLDHPLVELLRIVGRDRVSETCDDNFCPGEKVRIADKDRIELRESIRPGRELIYIWYTTDVEKVVREIMG
jgi:hypothetical protein